jgi:hypothetical protein
MSAPTVAEALLARRREWGVEFQTRHEELAAMQMLGLNGLVDARALLQGDPESGRLIRQAIKGKLAEILTR